MELLPQMDSSENRGFLILGSATARPPRAVEALPHAHFTAVPAVVQLLRSKTVVGRRHRPAQPQLVVTAGVTDDELQQWALTPGFKAGMSVSAYFPVRWLS